MQAKDKMRSEMVLTINRDRLHRREVKVTVHERGEFLDLVVEGPHSPLDAHDLRSQLEARVPAGDAERITDQAFELVCREVLKTVLFE